MDTMPNCCDPTLDDADRRRMLAAIVAALGASGSAHAQDAVVMQPRAYRVAFENDKLRVLEFNSKPGMGVYGNGMHSHPAHLTIALSAAKARFKLPDGRIGPPRTSWATCSGAKPRRMRWRTSPAATAARCWWNSRRPRAPRVDGPPHSAAGRGRTVLREELRSHLETLWPELRIVGEASDGLEALRLIDALAPALVFLDIEMPGLNGLEVARQVAADATWSSSRPMTRTPSLPSSRARGLPAQALLGGAAGPDRRPAAGGTWAHLAVAGRPAAELARVAPPRNYLRWINASHGNELSVIMVDEVLYFASDTKYTRVVTASKARP